MQYGVYAKSMFLQNRELFGTIKKLKLEIAALKITLEEETRTKSLAKPLPHLALAS